MRAKLTVVGGPAVGLTQTYESPDWFLLGRGADTHFRIPPDDYLSRHHFMMRIDDLGCELVDLESKNGVVVDGVRYGGRRPPPDGMPWKVDERVVRVSDGTVIEVGTTKIAVTLEMSAPAGRPEPATMTLPPAVVVDGGPRARDPSAPAPLAPTLTAAFAAKPGALPATMNPDFFPGYRLVSELGQGGMGIVYQAVESRTQRTVALKVLRPEIAPAPEPRALFGREVDVAAQLRHQNLVEVRGHGAVGDTLFLAMEFVEGQDLASLIRANPSGVALEEAAPLMFGLLDGLGHAHRATLCTTLADGQRRVFTGAVHRDVKPQNVLLGRGPGGRTVAKVSDFGLGKAFEAAGFTDMTRNGTFAGTPLYWPREQLSHYRYLGPPSDVFSAAAVCYELLAGRPMRTRLVELFAGRSPGQPAPGMAEVFTAILGQPAVPLRAVAPSVPAAVAEVIDRALREKEIANDQEILRDSLAGLRFVDAGAFRDALGAALRTVGIAA